MALIDTSIKSLPTSNNIKDLCYWKYGTVNVNDNQKRFAVMSIISKLRKSLIIDEERINQLKAYLVN